MALYQSLSDVFATSPLPAATSPASTRDHKAGRVDSRKMKVDERRHSTPVQDERRQSTPAPKALRQPVAPHTLKSPGPQPRPASPARGGWFDTVTGFVASVVEEGSQTIANLQPPSCEPSRDEIFPGPPSTEPRRSAGWVPGHPADGFAMAWDPKAPRPPNMAIANSAAALSKAPAKGFHPTLKASQGQIDGFFSQLPPESGGICGRLTYDLPLGCLQGGCDKLLTRLERLLERPSLLPRRCPPPPLWE